MTFPKMGERVTLTPIAKHVPVGPDAGPVWMSGPQDVNFDEFWCRQVQNGAVSWAPIAPVAAPAPALSAVEDK